MFIDPLGLSARQSWLGWAGSGVMTALRPVGQAIGYVFTPPGIRDMALRAEAGEQLNLGRATRLGARTRGPAVSVRDPSCFVAGTLVLLMGGDASAIDSIRVGDRVETSQGGTETDVDESWRVVHLLGQGYEASGDAFEVTLLRPTAWLEAHGVSDPGADVYLELKELGFRDWFTVSGLEDAPHIASGPGRVVLSTFTRLSNDVYEVGFGDGVAPLRGTGSHPLYSLDRDDWVRVRDLRIGERLQTAEGAISIVSLEKVRGTFRVYNLEVEGDHEFLIGDAQIRAHNQKGKVNLASPVRTKHILFGDGPGRGGHKFGLSRLFNGKSKFPATWSNDKIMHAVSEVVTNPGSKWVQQTGKIGAKFTKNGDPVKYLVEGMFGRTKIQVITDGIDIITAFPIK